MSITVISRTTKKLIIQSPSISESIKFIISLISSTIFYICIILIGLTSKFNVLDQAKIDCYRNEAEISCSLTGSNLYRKVEKVFSTKNGNIIKEAQTKPYSSENNEASLIIKTTREEFILSTQREIVHEQEVKLNTFLRNTTMAELNITTSYRNSNLLWLAYQALAVILFWKFFGIDRLFIDIFSSVNYIFDKSNGELIIQKAFWKFLPNNPPTNIPLHKIKKIYLQEKKNYSDGELIVQDIRISLYGNSKLLSINLMVSNNVELNEVHKIASFICEFLQLEPYKAIEIPP